MVEAVLDALANGEVTPIAADGSMPARLLIDAVLQPGDKQGLAKIDAVSALVGMAVNYPSARPGKPLAVGCKAVDGKIACWVEDFDTAKLSADDAKQYIGEKLRDVFKEMAQEKKAFVDYVKRGPQPYWMGSFGAHELLDVNKIMDALKKFHGFERLETQVYALPDGNLRVKCNADEMEALLRKEGLAAGHQAALQ